MSGEAQEIVEVADKVDEVMVEEVSREIIDRLTSNRAEAERQLNVGNSDCSIFYFCDYVHLDESHRQAILPRIVSIGYLHRPGLACDDFCLKDESMEHHKWRFLQCLRDRTGLDINDCVRRIIPMVPKATTYYNDLDYPREHYNIENIKVVVMVLLLDGCFILEFLGKFYGIIPSDSEDDPVFAMPWVVPALRTDLLKLSNQLPFFILEHLFDLTTPPSGRRISLAELVHNFLGKGLKLDPIFYNNNAEHLLLFSRSSTPAKNISDVKRRVLGSGFRRSRKKSANNAKHLLHFFHSTLIPSDLDMSEYWPSADLIPCATKLRTVGIKFKPAKEVDNFLKIKFSNGVLKIPPIAFDDSAASILFNCVAFERRYPYCSKHFSAYAIFMDSLINTAKDVAFLSDNKIIDNYFGTDEEVAHFFNALGKVAAVDIRGCHLSKPMVDVNLYYRSCWNEFRTSFMDTYFSSPWSLLSALAALVLLILTIIQAIYAVLAYTHSKS